MNNTKDIKEFYESQAQRKIEEALEIVKTEGFTIDSYSQLRQLAEFISDMESARHFFDAWHEEGRQAIKKGA